MEKNGNAT